MAQSIDPTPSSVLHRDINEPPRTVLSASGHYMTFESNRKVLDSTGGAAVSCLGHAHPRVLAAMAAQMQILTYSHSMFFSHEAGEKLGAFLAESTGHRLPRALLVSSGSEAMESSLKLARQYFLELDPPQPGRTKFISRWESYHGNTLGALAVGGHRSRRAKFEPLLGLGENVSFVSACNAYRGMKKGETEEEYVSRLKVELDEEFQRVGCENVCAFIAEPVVGAASGCVPAVKGYFKAVRQVCDKYGSLLILDEVMSGMGRTGTLHAWEQEDIVPDIQTIGKGLGGGYMPIAGVLISKKVVQTLERGTGKFMNGFTYQGHPLACAAALEVQKIIQEENLLQSVITMGAYLETKLKEVLLSHAHVGNIRGRGLFWGVELVADKSTKTPFDPSLGVSSTILEVALAQEPALMLYPGQGCVDGWRGDHFLIAPPYTITKEEIDIIVIGTKHAINSAIGMALKSNQESKV